MASYLGKCDRVAALLEFDEIDLVQKNYNGEGPLHLGAHQATLCPELVLDKRNDINDQNAQGNTAIRIAAEYGLWNNFETLLKAPGHDFDIPNILGESVR